MFLAISVEIVFLCIGAAILQQAFALFALWTLIKKEPKMKVFVPFNIISIIIPLFGPLLTLLYANRLPEPKPKDTVVAIAENNIFNKNNNEVFESTPDSINNKQITTDRKVEDEKVEDEKAEDKKVEDKKVEDRKAEDKKVEDRKAEDKKVEDKKVEDKKKVEDEK